jgi:hypothetical protein
LFYQRCRVIHAAVFPCPPRYFIVDTNINRDVIGDNTPQHIVQSFKGPRSRLPAFNPVDFNDNVPQKHLRKKAGIEIACPVQRPYITWPGCCGIPRK